MLLHCKNMVAIKHTDVTTSLISWLTVAASNSIIHQDLIVRGRLILFCPAIQVSLWKECSGPANDKEICSLAMCERRVSDSDGDNDDHLKWRGGIWDSAAPSQVSGKGLPSEGTLHLSASRWQAGALRRHHASRPIGQKRETERSAPPNRAACCHTWLTQPGHT